MCRLSLRALWARDQADAGAAGEGLPPGWVKVRTKLRGGESFTHFRNGHDGATRAARIERSTNAPDH